MQPVSGTAGASMAKRGESKPLWSSWSKQFEDGCSYNPAEAEEAEEQRAEAEAATQEQQLDTELLCELNAEATANDQFDRNWEFWRRVLRHVDVIPNERWKKAVRLWVLRDFESAPVFRNGFLVGETLRETGRWLLEAGEAVREKDGALRERPPGYLPGQIFPNGVQELLEHGLGFCLATELWQSDSDELSGCGSVREVGWDSLLEKCELWVANELRVKNHYTKTRRA
jgi:hypothetical protein